MVKCIHIYIYNYIYMVVAGSMIYAHKILYEVPNQQIFM